MYCLHCKSQTKAYAIKGTRQKNDKFYLSALCRSLFNLDFVHMGKLFLQLPLIACVVLVERWHFPSQVPPLCMPGSPTAVQVAEGG